MRSGSRIQWNDFYWVEKWSQSTTLKHTHIHLSVIAINVTVRRSVYHITFAAAINFAGCWAHVSVEGNGWCAFICTEQTGEKKLDLMCFLLSQFEMCMFMQNVHFCAMFSCVHLFLYDCSSPKCSFGIPILVIDFNRVNSKGFYSTKFTWFTLYSKWSLLKTLFNWKLTYKSRFSMSKSKSIIIEFVTKRIAIMHWPHVHYTHTHTYVSAHK